MPNKILPEDIGVNNLVNGKLVNYQRSKEPTPPSHLFKHCRHFWIADLDLDNRVYNPRILEWAPVTRKWYASGQVATYLKPIEIKGHFIISVVEVPDIPFEINV